MTKHSVSFPGGLQLEVETGATLKEVMNDAGINFDFPCGGRGRCGKCLVRVTAGVGEPLAEEKKKLTAEELTDGIRFACLTEVQSEMTVEFMSDKNIQHRILLSSLNRAAKVEPHLTKRYIEVDPATFTDQRTDWQRIKDGLAAQGNDSDVTGKPVAVLRTVPDLLRDAKNKVTAVVYNQEIRGLEAGNTSEKMYGIAFDIGTTTIAGFLMDLYTGEELSVASALNPQTQFGADVISRIAHANQSPAGLADLYRVVTQTINKLIGEAAEKAGVLRDDVYAVSIVGNTCMHHLFLGINPREVALAPYVPVISENLEVEPQALNLEINPAGLVFVLPNIAGFVGADTVGVLLATELDETDEIKLVVDIGTNGEMALGNKDRMFACSTAAGPAFEGAQISSGMRGATGAIDHVTFGDELKYSVIDDVKPLGICGSALLDIVAGMVEVGLLDERGRIMKPENVTHPIGQKLKNRLIEQDGFLAFLVADASETNGKKITVTQKDIRELQLAKGAMAAGIRILMNNYGIETDQIQEVLLAGAFGNYLNPHSACVIGLIPAELEERINMVGNAAGAGAKLALLSSSEYQRSANAARNVEFIELGSDPSFTATFARTMRFTR
ncbi:MAG TPA: ASKHA domain-containing protein [Oscillospiraceae bacterium]|nr:ASKHA domain-containing protein [Oscillospiraceae bacterium]